MCVYGICVRVCLPSRYSHDEPVIENNVDGFLPHVKFLNTGIEHKEMDMPPMIQKLMAEPGGRCHKFQVK